jgi:S-adenosylmethionine decarboxylase proenzyme
MNKVYSNLGKLVTVDFLLNKWLEWTELSLLCEEALDFSKMTVLNKQYHYFKPQGETCVWLLSESHMAVHTYPENKFFALDVFTCGEEANPNKVVQHFIKNLDIRYYNVNNIMRGIQT